MRLASMLLLAAGCGCSSKQPARSNATVPVVAAASSPKATENTVVQVEIAGRVTVAAGSPQGAVVVAVTDGPCFREGTHYLGFARPAPGAAYRIEVFPPSGTRLEVCAALVGPGVSFARHTFYWARADRGPLVAEGRGQVRYGAVDLTLAKAPAEVTIPDGVKLP